jgi:hypothetical protein
MAVSATMARASIAKCLEEEFGAEVHARESRERVLVAWFRLSRTIALWRIAKVLANEFSEVRHDHDAGIVTGTYLGKRFVIRDDRDGPSRCLVLDVERKTGDAAARRYYGDALLVE